MEENKVVEKAEETEKKEEPKKDPPKQKIELRAVRVTGHSMMTEDNDMDAFAPDGRGFKAQPVARGSAMMRASNADADETTAGLSEEKVREIKAKEDDIQNAFNVKDCGKAEKLCDEYIAMNGKNPDAYLYKGRALGYNAEGGIDGLKRAIEYIQKAIDTASDDKKKKYTVKAKDVFDEISNNIVKLNATRFENASASESGAIRDDLFGNIEYIITATSRTFPGDEKSVEDTKEHMARWLPIYAVRAQTKAFAEYRKISNYDNEKKTIVDFFNVTTNSIWLVDKAIELDGEENPKNIEYIDTKIRFLQQIFDTYDASYRKYQDFTLYGSQVAFDKIKSDAMQKIEDCKQKKKELNRIKVLNSVNEKDMRLKKNEERRVAGVENYWAEHPEEREKLEEKKANLMSQREELQQFKRNPPGKDRLDQYTVELKKLREERDKLNFLQQKRKDEIQNEIDRIEELRDDLEKEIKSSTDNIQKDINKIMSDIAEIDRELTRSRTN